MAWSSNASTAPSSASTSRATSSCMAGSGSCSSSWAISSVPPSRPCSSSQGVTQPLSVLISCTVDRALSGLAQNPASACDASSVRSRSALAVRSKKVSEFGDALLQLGEALDEIGHAGYSYGQWFLRIDGADGAAGEAGGGRHW